MNLEIIWSEFAEKQLDDIFEFYEKMLVIELQKKWFKV